MTFQAIAIVLGVNWVMHPRVADAVLFAMALALLIWEERIPMRITRSEPTDESEEHADFNEDHPDWET